MRMNKDLKIYNLLEDRFIERQIKQFCNNTVGHFLVAVIEGIT